MGAPETGLWRFNSTVLGALVVIALLYATAVFNVILPHWSYSVRGVGHLLVLTANMCLGTYCYLACVLVDPGRVPAGWQPEVEEQQLQEGALVEVKRGGGHRYCGKCQAHKPPRTHHCRRCQRCVLRMDHHCVWVNNCIGHRNYRAFILMCCYLALAAAHAAGLLGWYNAYLFFSLSRPAWRSAAGAAIARRARKGAGALHLAGAGAVARLTAMEAAAAAAGEAGSYTEWKGPFWIHATAQVVASALALPVTLALAVLLIWNLGLLLKNATTIEHHEGVRLNLLRWAGAGAGAPAGGGQAASGGAAGAAAVAAPGAAGGASPPGAGASAGGASMPRRGSAMNLQLLGALKAAPGPTPEQLGAAAAVRPPPLVEPPAAAVTAAAAAAAGGSSTAPAAAARGAGLEQPPPPPQQQQQPQQPQRGALGPAGGVEVRRYRDGLHPYDLGWLANLQAVFGEPEALWCLPVRYAAEGDGLAFPTRQGAAGQEQQPQRQQGMGS